MRFPITFTNDNYFNKWHDGKLLPMGGISIINGGGEWAVIYTGEDGSKECKRISSDFSSLSKSDWQSFMRWIDSVRQRIRASASR